MTSGICPAPGSGKTAGIHENAISKNFSYTEKSHKKTAKKQKTAKII